MKRVGRAGVAVVALMLVVGAFAATASANRFTPGSPGLGDPFFPNAGNGGYDVRHYTLDLDYDPATHRLVGTATIVAESTQGLKTLQPRPAPVPCGHEHRDGDEEGLQDAAGRVVARRAGADGRAPREDPGPHGLLRRGHLRGHRRADRRPRRLHRGLRPHGRRRLRRQRAAGLARLVPGQRQPEGQGALRHLGDRPRGADGARQRRASSPRRRRTGRRRGSGATRTRWRRTSRPRRSAGST